MKHENAQKSHDAKPFDPTDYPALREFFSGYLHQDFVEEYGSPTDALRGFLADASGDEILQVKEEWSALRRALRNRPWSETQSAITKLGSAWLPENESPLQEWDGLMSKAEA
jgi:CdiI immunity protein